MKRARSPAAEVDASPQPFVDGYQVECRAVEVGGGRGVFVTADMPAGSVLFAERPLLCVTEEGVLPSESWHMAVARGVLQSEHNAAMLGQLQSLHPQNLCDLAPSVLAEVSLAHAAATKRLSSCSESPHAVEDVLALLLKVQLNALECGLFVKLAMVNHACFPNSLLFSPGERDTGGAVAGSEMGATEIVATRNLRAGEEVTISFLGGERSAARRALLFARQHLVPLAAVTVGPVAALEDFAQGVEPSLQTRQALMRIEEQLDCAECKERLEFGVGNLRSSSTTAQRNLSDITALEKLAAALLHPCHIVLCRIHRLVASAAQEVLAVAPDACVAEQLVRSSLAVRASQMLYLPDTHWDRIKANESLALGIDAMLSLDRNRLFAAFAAEYPCFSDASLALAALRQDSARIRKLYSSHVDAAQPAAVSMQSTVAVQQSSPAFEASALQQGEDWSLFD